MKTDHEIHMALVVASLAVVSNCLSTFPSGKLKELSEMVEKADNLGSMLVRPIDLLQSMKNLKWQRDVLIQAKDTLATYDRIKEEVENDRRRDGVAAG